MMEDQRGLFIAFRLPKIVAHYEDDVNVIWVWLSGDISAKDNEAFEFAGAASEVVNAQQPLGDVRDARREVGAVSDCGAELRRDEDFERLGKTSTLAKVL